MEPSPANTPPILFPLPFGFGITKINNLRGIQHHCKSSSSSLYFKIKTLTNYIMHSPPSPDQQDDHLISLLNRHEGSGSATWKIRTNQLAHDDIRRQRRAAIATGNLKARRLSYHHIHTAPEHDIFPPNYVAADASDLPDHLLVPSIQSSDSDEHYFADNGYGELGKEIPVCLNALYYSPPASSSSVAASSSSSSSSSSSLLCKEIMKEQMVAIAKEEQNVTPTVGQKIREIGNSRATAKWEVPLACLAIASSVILLILFSLRCLGFGAFDEQPLPFLLLPT